MSDLLRLLKFVEQTDKCWIWIGNTNADGYGTFWYKGRASLSHRVSYRLHRGPIPKGKLVLHTCDNRACVNPAHLFLGSDADNIKDMHNKGRAVHNAPKGSANKRAKLIEDQVVEIRRLYGLGQHSQKQLANQFGVGTTTIDCILRRKNWKHI